MSSSGTQKQKKSGFFKTFLVLLSVLGISIMTLIAVAAFYEKEIGGLVISELKKTLKTNLEVESARLSLIWNFPNASVSLNNVKLKGLKNKKDSDLLVAERIALKCGIFGLLSGKYVFDNIEIVNATFNIYVDKNGKANYDIFKSKEEVKKEPQKLDLSIVNATLDRVTIIYADEKFNHGLSLNIEDAYLAGNFTDDRYDLKSNAKIICNHVKLDNENYLENKNIGYDAIINIDNKSKQYAIKKFVLDLEGNNFATEGSLIAEQDLMKIDLTLGSDKAKLGSLLKLLPESYQSSLGGFESNANLDFKTIVKGRYSAKELPKVSLKFGLKNGTVSHPKMADELKNVSFDISFNMKGGFSGEDAFFLLNNFKAKLAGHDIHLKMSSKGLENPFIDFSFDGIIPMKSVFGFFGENVSAGKGEVRVDELFLKGNLYDMLNPRKISMVELGGVIVFDDAGITSNDIPLTIEKGRVELKDKDLDLENITFKSAKSDFKLNGNCQNLLPVIFSDSTNSRKAELGFEIDLTSGKIDANELIEAFTMVQSDENASAQKDTVLQDSIAQIQNEKREFITQFLYGTIKAEVKELIYGKIKSKNFEGALKFENNVLKIMNWQLDAMNGKIGLDAKVFFEKEPYLLAFLDCENVDMSEMLEQTNNFGQKTLEAKNIKGQLGSVVKINAYWDSIGNFLDKKLVVIADMKLKNGELINFEMMKSMGQYIKLKDLEHIRFNELSNQFMIKDRVMHIPAMFIQSNAINLVISAKHSFNQDIDYKIKINAGQVIAQKMKKFNPNLPLIPAKKGLFNIYAMVSGNLNKGDYKFKLDKKTVKKHLDSEMSKEADRVSNVLKSEFEKTDIFNGENSNRADKKLKKIKKVSEPVDWDDETEGKSKNETDYIEGF